MPIIYSYPQNNNILSTDVILCTSTSLINGNRNQTKSLSIGSLTTFILTSPSNNLNQVLTNGNISQLNAKIGELYLYDDPNGGYGKISMQDNSFLVYRENNTVPMFIVDNGNTMTLNNGSANAVIINPLTTDRTYTLPNKSGTIALTTDIVVPNLQLVTDFGDTTSNDITANSFIKTGGTAGQYLMANGSTSTMPTMQQVVEAGATSDIGIQVTSILGNAIIATSIEADAIVGNSTVNAGVVGLSIDGLGVRGQSTYAAGGFFTSVEDVGGFFSSTNSYSLVAAQSAAKPGGGSWSVYSDSRIKENIVPYTKGLADILLINTVTYEYNGLAGTAKGAKYTGIIAQEMKEIFPDTIGTYKAKLNEEDEEKTELYDFNSSDLTFALINAIKELKAEIEILKAK